MSQFHGDYGLTLRGPIGYGTHQQGMDAINLTSGDIIGRVSATHTPILEGRSVPAPLMTEASEGHRLLALFPSSISGSGTTADSDVVEVVAVNPTTIEETWRLDIDVADWDTEDQAVFLGATDTTAVVRLGDSGVLGIDLNTHRVAWHKETGDLFAAVFADGTVVGIKHGGYSDEDQLVAVSAADGQVLWRETVSDFIADDALQPVGGAVLLNEDPYLGDGPRLLDVASGEVIARYEPNAVSQGVECRDAVGVSVCSTSQRAFALDHETGEMLWRLPDSDAGRVAPDITTVHNGLVYGETDNGPVVLDARTGADEPVSPGITPVIVSEYVGIVDSGEGQHAVHRAAG